MNDIAVATSAIVESMLEGPQADRIDKVIAAAGVVLVTPIGWRRPWS